MFVLDLQSRVPIYEQMKKKIRELVLLGVLAPGEQLPTVRSLARELGINPNTVQKAYQELEHDGIVYSITGRGSFVAQPSQENDGLQRAARASLLEALQSARLSGISKEEAAFCMEDVYRGGRTR